MRGEEFGMKRTKYIIALALIGCGGANAQDSTYGLTLAPGETIIGVYNAPSVMQMLAAPVYETVPYETVPYDAQAYVPPPVEIDRVRGIPRNQVGWSGDTGGPAGIGCFPQGVCAHLN